jgi:hypothetical protein
MTIFKSANKNNKQIHQHFKIKNSPVLNQQQKSEATKPIY